MDKDEFTAAMGEYLPRFWLTAKERMEIIFNKAQALLGGKV